jgi:hypothetical protein
MAAVLAGTALNGAWIFFGQGTVTALVSRNASTDRAAASGLYLTSYYLDRFGSVPTALGIDAAIGAAARTGRVVFRSAWPNIVETRTIGAHRTAAKRTPLTGRN